MKVFYFHMLATHRPDMGHIMATYETHHMVLHEVQRYVMKSFALALFSELRSINKSNKMSHLNFHLSPKDSPKPTH